MEDQSEEYLGDDDKKLSDIEIDDSQIEAYFCNEQERQLKRNLWNNQNAGWLAHQKEKKRERKE